MAKHGARNIIVISRSGIDDEASARVVASCNSYKCEVTEARGDVSDIAFIRGVFESASPRIAGVIQGAMVLRVSFANLITKMRVFTSPNARLFRINHWKR